jgi:glycosyltransferase involved in cell wall biosynthesis
MPVFSLIVPIYNVETCLAECLDSCINQTFTDIEIICINDCSTDNSKVILEQYAKRDQRIKIINHVNNKGLGAARNTGIEAAIGDYCWFIDSDDYIILNACEILNDIIAQVKADIIRFNRIDYDYDISSKKKTMLPQLPYSWAYNRLFTKAEHIKLKMLEVSACMYITSTILLKTVKFREGVLHEDNDFTPILFSKSETIYNSNYSLYCVRQRLGSITRNEIIGMSPKMVIDSLLALDALNKYIISEKLSKYHFCTRTAVCLCSLIKPEYKKYSEIHTKEHKIIIEKAEEFGTFYIGEKTLYDSIITAYGNTKLLDFILKVYRFIIKRILKTKTILRDK